MYTTRSHTFKIKNVSLIALKYNLKVVSASNAQIDPGYFTINPKSGVINS